MNRGVLAVLLAVSLSAAGCSVASVSEVGKRFLGVSTEDLEIRRGKGIKKVFDLDIYACFSKAKEIIKAVDGYIYAADEVKESIAFYRTETDTTPVGIFFRLIDMKRTEVEIVSPSDFTSLEVADKIFLGLEGKPIPKTKPKKIIGDDDEEDGVWAEDEDAEEERLDEASRDEHEFKPISRNR